MSLLFVQQPAGTRPRGSKWSETRMSKRKSSKYKLDRRMGENIWGRPKSSVNRRSYGPGQHGQRRKSKVSEIGRASCRERVWR